LTEFLTLVSSWIPQFFKRKCEASIARWSRP